MRVFHRSEGLEIAGMFEGAKPPLLTRMLRPERAVDIAYAGFKKNEYMIREPFMVKITPALKGLLPYRIFDAISDLFGTSTSMSGWTGHGT